MSPDLVRFAYLVAASLFVFGLKGLSHPRTAVRGNRLSALGMFIAIVVTLIDQQIVRFEFIVAGIVLGGAIGAIWALKVPMTAMPQFVGCATVSAAGRRCSWPARPTSRPPCGPRTPSRCSSASRPWRRVDRRRHLLGSLIAFGKLQGIVSEKPFASPEITCSRALPAGRTGGGRPRHPAA